MGSTASGTAFTNVSVQARAFARSLTMVLKYVRLYGFEHARTRAQFDVAWHELRHALSRPSGVLLGVAGSKLLLDGVVLNTGPAERGFIELLAAADIASLQFLPSVTTDDFQRLVRAFSAGKPADVLRQLKQLLPQGPNAAIRLNELRYVEEDKKQETDLAANLTVRALEEGQTAINLGDWLNDPQKLLQLIFAAQGGDKAGPEDEPQAGSGGGGGTAAPVAEDDLMGIMRWLTQLGKVQAEADQSTAGAALQAGLTQLSAGSVKLVQQTLAHMATLPQEGDPSSMLAKLAEHLAIRFALERYERGDVKVNAVRELLDRMNGEMENLRKILRSHEQAMGRAGLTVETHAQILDRQFWAAVPEQGKLTVLLSPEAACIPARNVRTFVEELLERGDKEQVVKILGQYVGCIVSSDAELRRRTALGLSELADLYSRMGADLMLTATQQAGEQLIRESMADQMTLLTAAFIRLAQEAINGRHYAAVEKALETIQEIEQSNPLHGQDMRLRIAIEGRVREFLEDALNSPALPSGLPELLRWTPRAAVEHAAMLFGQCMKRQECDRLLELLAAVGDDAVEHLRAVMLTRPPAEAVQAVGLRSRLDLPVLEQDLPPCLPKWGRLQQDELVRQLSFGAAAERGRLLLAILPLLDKLIQPLAIEEAGLSVDPGIASDLLQLAQGQGLAAGSAYLQLKAIEALGRLRGDRAAAESLKKLARGRSLLGWQQPREIRIAAAQALVRMGHTLGERLGLSTQDLCFAPCDGSPGDWARPRRYPRVAPARPLSVTAITSKGRTSLTVSSISLGGGLVNRGNTRAAVSPEAVLEVSSGVRKLRMNVIVRENRARELAFEILNIDLQDLNRLRHILIEQLPTKPAE